jgi:hypothetical protein
MSMLAGYQPWSASIWRSPVPRGSSVRPYRYRIIVSGRLGEITREIFADLCLEFDGANTGLTGELDQPALRGVLSRIPDFGLGLLALSRLDDEPAETRRLRHVADPEGQRHM